MNFTVDVEKEKKERDLKCQSTIDILSEYIVFEIENTGLDSTYH